MYGYPVEYHGYSAESTDVKVTRVHLDSGVSERFNTSVDHPTFMFRSVGFKNQEISPYSSRVAFSDGVSINVYDDSEQKVIARAPVTGPIEGTWWQDDHTVILGLGLLSEEETRFAIFDVEDSTVTDATERLLPLWDGSWSKADWFKMPKK
jgi:hypothetical protein